MLSILVIVLVVLLLVADACIFGEVGFCVGAQKTIKALQEKGWTVEPPEENDNDRKSQNNL